MLSLRPYEIGILVLLAILYALFEGVGVGMLAPVMQYVESGKAVQGGSVFWTVLEWSARGLGVPITLFTLLIMAFLPILIRQVVYFVFSYYGARTQQRAATRLRSEGFSALIHGDLAFVIAKGFGNLVSTLTVQVQRGGQAIYQFVQLISTGVLLLMYVLVLFLLQPALAAITLVATWLISFMVRGSITRSRHLGMEAAERNNTTYTELGEQIAAVRLVKMLGQEDAATEKVTELVRGLEEVQVRIGISRGVIEVTVDPLQMLAIFAVVYLGSAVFHATLASLGLFLFILLRMNQKAKEFSIGRQTLASNMDSLEMVRATISEANASRTITSGEREFTGLREAIELRGVAFAYDDGEMGEPVLRDIDVVIPQGWQVAIVGRSGAGKSTLVDLVPRLREPIAGEILFDGVPAREFDLRTLRRSIGFMTQDAVLFNDTVRFNLTYGLEREPTEDEIRQALEKSWSAVFIDALPEGLETQVGDRGVRLSGGQRQRLALARVFLQDPDVLILDEPTSALDSESEEYIQKALATLHGEKTLIVIAHRLSTVQRSDEIIVLEQGSIVERGTHDALLAQGSAYKRLFDLQIYHRE